MVRGCFKVKVIFKYREWWRGLVVGVYCILNVGVFIGLEEFCLVVCVFR